MLTKDDAEAIAKKLGARIKNAKAHDIAVIEYEGKRITQFGIRRGSRRDQSHAHLPGSLFMKPHDVKEMAICNISYDEWVSLLKEKGLIEPNTSR